MMTVHTDYLAHVNLGEGPITFYEDDLTWLKVGFILLEGTFFG